MIRSIVAALPLLLFLGGAGAEVPAAESQRRPNILFIFTDDQSHRSVSCYEEAHPWVSTPHIDRLAAEGVRFTSAYAGTWCLPSRAMVLTGLHPHGIQGLRVERNPVSRYDPEVCRFWPAAFREAGYQTAFIGKWHLSPDAGHGRDWDHSIVWNHAVPKKAGGYYRNQKLNFDGGPHQAVGGYSTDNYTQYAEAFLRREHKRPWFLWLCYDGIHGPYTAAERHQQRYRNDEPVLVPKDVFPPRPDKPTYMHNYTVWKRGADGLPVMRNRALPEWVRQYNRAALALDEGVGRLMKVLEETGQSDNTLVVYTSDQGYAWGQHGFAWKVAPYDANLRVPMIVRMPGRVARGKVCRSPVCTLDLVATFWAMAQTPPPWKLHGRDLSPILDDPEASWPHPVMMEFFRREFGSQTDGARTGNAALGGVPWYLFLREGRYKYTRYLLEDEIEELYDLAVDPKELHNLAGETRHRGTLAAFRRRLAEELTRTEAPLRKNLPEPKTAASP